MKKPTIIIFIIALLLLTSCKKDSKSTSTSIPERTQRQESTQTSHQIKEVINDFNKVANKSNVTDKNATITVNRAEIERRYRLSKIPKQEYLEKLNNPDTLKKLIRYVEKEIKDNQPRSGLQLNGKISVAELTSKNTSTGKSIQEAILLLKD
jgi:uncharacterized lipoprotein YajG